MSRYEHNQLIHKSSGGVRWQWYHYYFLLAAFDLVVIIGGFLLHTQTLNSYELALHKLGNVHEKLRYVAALRLGVVNLNAPGNDVFASRDVNSERKRFDQAKESLTSLMDAAEDTDIDVTESARHIRNMSEQSMRVFSSFDKLSDESSGVEIQRQAAVAMAEMDHYQALALTSLTEIDQHSLMRIDSILAEYSVEMVSYNNSQKFLASVVVVILLGAFWYGRKLQDMHERMEENHRAALVARKERLAAIGELCAGVAHGIRNPLASILTSAQLGLSIHKSDDAISTRMTDIANECRRLDHRLTRLIEFASGATEAVQEYDLRAAVAQARDEIKEVMAKAKIPITIDGGDQPLVVQGDRERMVQAFIEIFSNAIEHGHEGCSVSVVARHCPDHNEQVEIIVEDNGPGIDDCIRDRVFDLFFTTTQRGTGIGLAVVKDAVSGHGGTVTVDTANEKGARLRICMPLI